MGRTSLSHLIACLSLFLASLGQAATAQEPPKKAIDDAPGGKVFSWESADGLAYEFRLPKEYDPEVGLNLTFVLHGSNLSRRWTFLNHDPKSFRVDDLVVSPDGTTSNGSGGFNFLQGKKDLQRLRALHEEIQALFPVRSTFLYGHSQGSFFSFLYAGAYPAEVNGVLGHASGTWIGTSASKKHHHQAIVLMHGTADPVVNYGQSVGGLRFYQEQKYPMVRLRSLEGWNHWPAEGHAAQQLAWCEAMTTEDPLRIEAAFEELDSVKEWLDPVALRQVASRAATFEGVSAKTVKAAEKAMEAVDKVMAKHLAAIEKSLGKNTKRSLDGRPWVGHTGLFLRSFEGLEGALSLREDWSKSLDAHAAAATKHWPAYRRKRDSNIKAAFAVGLDLVEEAFLQRTVQDLKFLDRLDGWAKDAKEHDLDRRALKRHAPLITALRDGLEAGAKAFQKVDRRIR